MIIDNKMVKNMEELKNKSEFFHFGILPGVCVHTPERDQYSAMYKAREKCDCGASEWLESTMILGHCADGTPVYKDVHRCKSCNEVRMADHIGVIL
jgi:hypothetical protein